MPGETSERVLVVAPLGRDAAGIASLLEQNALRVQVCADVLEACACIAEGAGALVLTEEALDRGGLEQFIATLDAQPAWSELPVIVLTTRAAPDSPQRLELLRRAARVITMLERPTSALGLLRNVQVALSSRRRQYQVRDLILAQHAAEEALRTTDRRKDEFLATLSHELRNPMAPIRTAAHLLASPTLSARDLQWVQLMLQRQVTHMAGLLDDLLNIARITQGKLELRKEHVTITSVIETAAEAAKPLVDAKRHTLVLELASGLPEIHVDPLRLAEVLTNLLTNAAKYTLPGGRIELSANVTGNELVLEVTDTGIGMDPEALSHVFEMFTQAPGATVHSEGGLGIGLALAKGLVELHGGRIDARSEGPGRGSTFTIRLPVPDGSERRSASQLRERVLQVHRRILVVDDNRDGADSLSMLLRIDGHEVCVAYDGDSGISAAREFGPDVALLDIGLPDMTGYDLARTLRSQHGEGLRLIALTGWGQDEDRRRAAEAGFDQHLVKPIDAERLESVLAAANVPPARGTALGRRGPPSSPDGRVH